MSELVLGPPDTRPVEMTTDELRTARARLFTVQLDQLAAAWRDDPTAAFDWMVGNGIASRVGGLLRPGPCVHVRAAGGSTHCPDCGGPVR